MTNSNYTRTSGSKNKVNKRHYNALQVMPGAVIDSHGKKYWVTRDGVRVAVEGKGNK